MQTFKIQRIANKIWSFFKISTAVTNGTSFDGMSQQTNETLEFFLFISFIFPSKGIISSSPLNTPHLPPSHSPPSYTYQLFDEIPQRNLHIKTDALLSSQVGLLAESFKVPLFPCLAVYNGLKNLGHTADVYSSFPCRLIR